MLPICGNDVKDECKTKQREPGETIAARELYKTQRKVQIFERSHEVMFQTFKMFFQAFTFKRQRT